MGLGLVHYIPLVAYLGFWVVAVRALAGKPLQALYFILPFIPYRTMRDKLDIYPLGGQMLTIVIVSIVLGALIKGKRLPPSRLYLTWIVFGVYLYFSMWIGVAISNAPAPLWLSDVNFVTWKDYMLIPILFFGAALVLEDRKAIRTCIILVGFSLLMVDRSAFLESLSHSWNSFDETKRTAGPLSYGSNQLGAYLAQFAMFFWGFARMIQRRKVKLISYGLVAFTVITTLYTFSRASYLALLVSAFVLAVVKDRKLLIVLAVFLFTWQAVVPTAVTERVNMTENQNGQLEASAQERVDLWEQSKQMFLGSPVFGRGYATFQMGEHTDNLKDTHNWYVKVLVETGLIGGVIAVVLLGQMVAIGWRLFRTARDPMYGALGLGFLLSMVSCLVANMFGDRWTYLEITGPLWVLAAAVLRALQLEARTTDEPAGDALAGPQHPGMQPPGTPSLAPHLEWS